MGERYGRGERLCDTTMDRNPENRENGTGVVDDEPDHEDDMPYEERRLQSEEARLAYAQKQAETANDCRLRQST